MSLTEVGGTGDLADVIQFTDVASTEVSFERRGEPWCSSAAPPVIRSRSTTSTATTTTTAVYAPPQVEQFRFTDTTLNVKA